MPWGDPDRRVPPNPLRAGRQLAALALSNVEPGPPGPRAPFGGVRQLASLRAESWGARTAGFPSGPDGIR